MLNPLDRISYRTALAFLQHSFYWGNHALGSFFALRNAIVSMGADRKQLDAIWKQSALSIGATALIALPICFVAIFLIEMASRMLGQGVGEANFVGLAIRLAVSGMCLLASVLVGWRLLGERVYSKYAYTDSQ